MTTTKSNVVLHLGQIVAAQRARRLGQHPLTVWLSIDDACEDIMRVVAVSARSGSAT